MLKLENSIRGLSFSRVAFDLTIQVTKKVRPQKGLTFAYSHGMYKSCYYWKSTKKIFYIHMPCQYLVIQVL